MIGPGDERARYSQLMASVPRLAGEDPENARMRELFFLGMAGPLSVVLDRKDRMSMAAGLDVRIPFCDYRLVEYVWNVPWRMKCSGGVKGLLKAAVSDIVPPSTLNRRKSAYPHVQNPIYRQAIIRAATRIANDKSAPVAGLFDTPRLNELIRQISANGILSELPGGSSQAALLIRLLSCTTGSATTGCRSADTGATISRRNVSVEDTRLHRRRRGRGWLHSGRAAGRGSRRQRAPHESGARRHSPAVHSRCRDDPHGEPEVRLALQDGSRSHHRGPPGDHSEGRLFGGSNAINGRLFVRGQRQDYDRWENLGNPGWSWADVLPYSAAWSEHPSLAATQARTGRSRWDLRVTATSCVTPSSARR